MFQQNHNTIENIINNKKLLGAPGSKGVIEGKVTIVQNLEADRAKFKPGGQFSRLQIRN